MNWYLKVALVCLSLRTNDAHASAPRPPHTAGECVQVSFFFSAGNCHLAWLLWWFFFCYTTLWDSKIPHWPCLRNCFLLCGNFFSFKSPSPGWISVLKSLVSLFIFIVITSKRLVCLPGYLQSSAGFRSCFVEVVPHADDLLMYLWERK